MKKFFELPEIELEKLTVEDVITTSPIGNPDDGDVNVPLNLFQ